MSLDELRKQAEESEAVEEVEASEHVEAEEATEATEEETSEQAEATETDNDEFCFTLDGEEPESPRTEPVKLY